MNKSQIEQGVKKGTPWVARALALIAIIAFFLPFCTISCSGQEVDTVNAAEIAAGKEIEFMGESEWVDGDPKAFILLALPLVVLLMSFYKKQIITSTVYIAQAIGILLYNRFLFDTIETTCSDYGCTVHSEIGYMLFQLYGWLIILLGIGSIVATIMIKGTESDLPPEPNRPVEPSPKDFENELVNVNPLLKKINNINPSEKDDVWKEEPSEVKSKDNRKEKKEVDPWYRPTGFDS